jgi:hypothetical protein
VRKFETVETVKIDTAKSQVETTIRQAETDCELYKTAKRARY